MKNFKEWLEQHERLALSKIRGEKTLQVPQTLPLPKKALLMKSK